MCSVPRPCTGGYRDLCLLFLLIWIHLLFQFQCLFSGKGPRLSKEEAELRGSNLHWRQRRAERDGGEGIAACVVSLRGPPHSARLLQGVASKTRRGLGAAICDRAVVCELS